MTDGNVHSSTYSVFLPHVYSIEQRPVLSIKGQFGCRFSFQEPNHHSRMKAEMYRFKQVGVRCGLEQKKLPPVRLESSNQFRYFSQFVNRRWR